jgi:hypothetical protein
MAARQFLAKNGPLTAPLRALWTNPGPGTQMTVWTSSAPSWAAFEPGIPHEPKQAPPPEPKG